MWRTLFFCHSGTDYVGYNVTEEYSTSGQFDNGVKSEQFTESYHTESRGR